jgi:glycosyltransferase involved in cell wall biosynthesis
MAQSVAGLVTLHPNGNYLNAQPVKLFEYMAAGIPVIASDFPLWRRIVEDAECGLLVDPLDPRAIAAAVDWLVDNPEAAQRMGESGRKAILKRYSWDVEKRRLFQFYDAILEGEVHRG